MLVGPFFNGLEHIPLNFDTVVAEGGVVEYAEDVVDDLINGDTWIFPGVQNTACECQCTIFCEQRLALTEQCTGES